MVVGASVALELAMEELRSHILIVAGRLLPRREDAEDVTQETMLRLVKARSNGMDIAHERAFAVQTAVRLALNRVRTARGRTAKLRQWVRLRPSAAYPLELPPDVERLVEAIAALPPKQAAVVTLRHLMEMEYRDIAAILGISIESCRSHSRLGLQRLRLTYRPRG